LKFFFKAGKEKYDTALRLSKYSSENNWFLYGANMKSNKSHLNIS
jgi:hypothetical protein